MNVYTIKDNIKQNTNVYDDEIWNKMQFHINQLNNYMGMILSDIIHEESGSLYLVNFNDLEKCTIEGHDKEFNGQVETVMDETRELIAILYRMADRLLESEDDYIPFC